jgi:esterase/lipase superfamily enzyme
MSYARWGWDGSDVYVFTTKNVEGHYVVECCGCFSKTVDVPYKDFFGIEHNVEFSSFYAKTRKEIDDHLKEHQLKGDFVTEDTFEGLEKDYPDSEKLIDDYEKEVLDG